MIRRFKAWQVAAALFALGNLAGAVWAAVEGGAVHTAAHVALTLLGAYLVLWLDRRARREERPGALLADQRLEQLQQSVDAVALEVERIGEAQRFSAKLQAERTEIRR